jgi:CBS domain-containing protein
MKAANLIGSRTEVYSITDETRPRAPVSRADIGRPDAHSTGKLVGVISHSDVSDKVAAENKCPVDEGLGHHDARARHADTGYDP